MGILEGKLQRIWWWVWATTQSIVGAVLVLVILPIVIPVIMVLWIWRCIAVLLVRLIHKQWAQPASGMEALFALDSVGARAVICGVAILKGRLNVTTVRKLLSERILDAKDEKGNYLHPKFRQVVEKRCGVVVWMWEENFNVARHVKQLQMKNRRARLLHDEDDITMELSARTNDPFVRGHARWEVFVAPLKQYRKYGDVSAEEKDEEDWNHTVIMLRVHHALGDGRSLVGLIVSALVDPPLSDPRPSPVCRHSLNDCATRTLRMLWSISHLPWVMIRIFSRGDSSVLHGSRLGGVKHIAWSPPMSLAALKRGRPLAGVSVNDLLLTGLSAALNRHFRMESSEVPSQVMTVLPVDVTAPGTPLSLANRISLCTVPLPTNKLTPKERLMLVHRRMNILKSSPDVMVNYMALDLISNLLPSPIARRALATHGVTMVASNMPGPTEKINLFGESVDDIMFWIPNKSRTGLGVSMLSYCGDVRVGLNVDSALIPYRDVAQQLLENLVMEVENILAAIAPNDEKVQANYEVMRDHLKSYSSDLTEIVVTHSTDEYDDQHRMPTYSDLHASSELKKLNDLDSTFGSDESGVFESQQLLRTNFNTTRIEIQSFLTSGNDKGVFTENRLKTRLNKSETDVNILTVKLDNDV